MLSSIAYRVVKIQLADVGYYQISSSLFARLSLDSATTENDMASSSRGSCYTEEEEVECIHIDMAPGGKTNSCETKLTLTATPAICLLTRFNLKELTSHLRGEVDPEHYRSLEEETHNLDPESGFFQCQCVFPFPSEAPNGANLHRIMGIGIPSGIPGCKIMSMEECEAYCECIHGISPVGLGPLLLLKAVAEEDSQAILLPAQMLLASTPTFRATSSAAKHSAVLSSFVTSLASQEISLQEVEKASGVAHEVVFTSGSGRPIRPPMKLRVQPSIEQIPLDEHKWGSKHEPAATVPKPSVTPPVAPIVLSITKFAETTHQAKAKAAALKKQSKGASAKNAKQAPTASSAPPASGLFAPAKKKNDADITPITNADISLEQLKKFNMDSLKHHIKELNKTMAQKDKLKLSGKKDDLVARIFAYHNVAAQTAASLSAMGPQNPITGDVIMKRKADDDAATPTAKKQTLDKPPLAPGVTFGELEQLNDSDFEGFDTDDDNELTMGAPLALQQSTDLGNPISSSLVQVPGNEPTKNNIAVAAATKDPMDSGDEFAAWEDVVLAEGPTTSQVVEAPASPQKVALAPATNVKKRKEVQITPINASDPSCLTPTELMKLNVDSLKAHLKSLKLKITGKKELLVDRIVTHHAGSQASASGVASGASLQ